MPNPNFLAITANMIAEVQRRGCTPVSFVMNRATQAHIANELWQAHRLRMSALGKLWHWMRQGKTVPRLETLHGLSVVDGPHLQPGAVFLQSHLRRMLCRRSTIYQAALASGRQRAMS